MLRGRGFFLRGLLPPWFDDDGLLMQKIMDRPDREGIHLYSGRAIRILGMVKWDREQVRNR